MRTPPFLIGASLVFWGWRNDLWLVGVLTGLVLELSRFISLRWDFTEKDYRRIWDICILLAGGVALYFRFGDEAAKIGFRFIQWLPILFPSPCSRRPTAEGNRCPGRFTRGS